MIAFIHRLAAAGATPRPPTPRPGFWPPVLILAGAMALGTSVWSALPAEHAPAISLATAPVAAAMPPAAARQPAPRVDTLDALRQAAALGNVDASIALVGALLDRYDIDAGTPALFEALQWLQRDLDTAPVLASAELQRVVLGPCRRDALLQWHWLCDQGE